MKKVLCALLAVVSMTACMKDKPENNANSGETTWNKFSYSTIAQTPLTIDYSTSAPVYFEIYDKSPVAVNESGTAYQWVGGEDPLYAGYTDSKGHFAETIALPSYLDKAYIYTPNVFAQTILVGVKTNGTLAASVANDVSASLSSMTRATYESAAVTKDGWKTWLGSYDSTYGRINYAYTGTDKNLILADYAALLSAAGSVFNATKSCPSEYLSSTDLYVSKTAEISVTFLMSNTCWNCSMGYYYYKVGETPKSLSDIHPIMLFPNTQDGDWAVNPKLATQYKGVDRGTTVQLKYYPNIATGSTEGETTIFPAGYRIGFILATNAWGNQLPNFKGAKTYRAATTAGLSINNNGVAYTTPRTAVYSYTNESLNIKDAIICSFEDFKDDANFSDVIFTTQSNPIEAIHDDIPEIEDKDDVKTAHLLKGIYAFEDLWPSRGDFDMNDVLIKSNCDKSFSTKGIYKEAYMLKTFSNSAAYDNGMAVYYTGTLPISSLSFSILRKGASEYEAYTPASIEGNTIVLTNNVKDDMNASYMITADYGKTPISESRAITIKPFLFRDTQSERDVTVGLRKEIHLPNEVPTDKVDPQFFGKGDDMSQPAKGIYYVRAEYYPFAFFLAGATEADLSLLLNAKNEKTPIDVLYPRYMSWAKSNGAKDMDWYK